VKGETVSQQGAYEVRVDDGLSPQDMGNSRRNGKTQQHDAGKVKPETENKLLENCPPHLS
jgi:hypothetical protein